MLTVGPGFGEAISRGTINYGRWGG